MIVGLCRGSLPLDKVIYRLLPSQSRVVGPWQALTVVQSLGLQVLLRLVSVSLQTLQTSQTQAPHQKDWAFGQSLVC